MDESLPQPVCVAFNDGVEVLIEQLEGKHSVQLERDRFHSVLNGQQSTNIPELDLESCGMRGRGFVRTDEGQTKTTDLIGFHHQLLMVPPLFSEEQ